MSEKLKALEEVFGEVIYRYTRAQAIADGMLIDVTGMAKTLGFKIPVAVTQGVWADHVSATDIITEKLRSTIERQRLSDLLIQAYVSARAAKSDRIDIFGRVIALCHGGDEAEPVVTIMFPEEE